MPWGHKPPTVQQGGALLGDEDEDDDAVLAEAKDIMAPPSTGSGAA
jgi:hypothetical protein